MKIFDRLSNGWKIGKMSLKTIHDHPSLMLFPVVSGISLILVTLSFFGGGYLLFGGSITELGDEVTISTSLDMMSYLAIFAFYILNYFVIVFFNVGLVHCARKILNGKETSVGEGINFALSRISTIFAWSVLAATVGMILKTIQERAGAIGGMITGLIGMVWGIATFFVVPVLAFEEVTPIQAVKRSASIIKEKWGESLGANFSFGLFSILGFFLVVLPTGFIFGAALHPVAGIIMGIILFLILQTVVSAASMIFLTAAYEHVNDNPNQYFDDDLLDDMFVGK